MNIFVDQRLIEFYPPKVDQSYSNSRPVSTARHNIDLIKESNQQTINQIRIFNVARITGVIKNSTEA